jgi:hypothetical protein
MHLIHLGVAPAGSLKAGHQTLDGFSRRRSVSTLQRAKRESSAQPHNLFYLLTLNPSTLAFARGSAALVYAWLNVFD